MNITEDYVSFEVAKLLKEKGFDCASRLWYDNKGVVSQKYIDATNSPLGKVDHYPCITLSLAMKWLREVHKIDIVCFHERLPHDCYWCRIEKYPYTEHQQEPTYQRYEQAVEAALKYALENLI